MNRAPSGRDTRTSPASRSRGRGPFRVGPSVSRRRTTFSPRRGEFQPTASGIRTLSWTVVKLFSRLVDIGYLGEDHVVRPSRGGRRHMRVVVRFWFLAAGRSLGTGGSRTDWPLQYVLAARTVS